MPRMNALSSYATTIATDAAGVTRITYHSTVIVEFDAETITLRTGGYDTVTTRRKMQQAANQFSLGYSVFREKGISYVGNRISRVPPGRSRDARPSPLRQRLIATTPQRR